MVQENITIDEKDKKWLDAQVASGRFRSVGDVIHELIKPWNAEPMSKDELAMALKAGEESGISDQDPREILSQLKAEFST